MITTGQLRALDLVGPDEIARRFGVRSSAVANWRARGLGFPDPELRVSRVNLWRWEVVRDWATSHGRTLAPVLVTTADLARALELLPKVRDQVRREVRAAADAVVDLLGEPLRRPDDRAAVRVNGRFSSLDGRSTSGEWDWFWMLPEETRARLRRRMSTSESACRPDEWATAMAWRTGNGIEEPMAEWVNAANLADAADLVDRGKVPAWPVRGLGLTYDPGQVFGPTEEAAGYLARLWAEEAEGMAEVAEVEPEANPLPVF